MLSDNKFAKVKSINWQDFFFKYRYQILLLLVGLGLIGLGFLAVKSDNLVSSSKVEVLESNTESQIDGPEVIVEVAGAVESPGVYKLVSGARIEDALIAAGGISANASRDWIEKTLNRAAKITDGQKIYIPRLDEQSTTLSAKEDGEYQTISSGQGSDFEDLVNVNTASQKELESLWGIGPVTAQNIIEQRPYSSVEELLNKRILKSNIYERNKDKLTIY